MKIPSAAVAGRGAARAGFSLIEVCVAIAVMGIVFVALYNGLASGFKTVGATREELRATQILIEKLETTRVYTWSQVTNSAFPAFQASYDPTANGASRGLTYHGTYAVSKVEDTPVDDSHLKDANYGDTLRVVTVTVKWTNINNRAIQRSLSTLVAQDGLYNYAF